ncbi:hypothetical protein [Helicobacter sp. 11S02596-1]|uniref:hypothetical protein n=1 Tax=Helicobacter sp. 11S02596-1 TaxID=1476194 RepID=UPI000BA68A35|nr:hypothetical protein [Helicobacter sp. 11S02596-1]PAF42108.1 hypothetical protein BJI48_07295 [Helicobacter sp. 11S02596-1]
MKILFLSLALVLVSMQAYDFNTWKKNPPVLTPPPFFELPAESNPLYRANTTSEPFTPPFLPPLSPFSPPFWLFGYPNGKFFYQPIPGILPQVLPSDLPPPDFFDTGGTKPLKKEFLISYRLVIKDGVAQGDRYRISEPIKARVGTPRYVFDYQCRIDSYIADILGDDEASDALKIILEAKKDAVLECLYKSGVQVRDDTLNRDFALRAKTTLTLPAKSVIAYLDNGFLILEVWKEKR